MRKVIVPIGLAAALVAAFLIIDRTAPPPQAPGALALSEQQAADVPLLGLNGPTNLRAFQGQWTVVTFGYRSCPDVCPMTLGTLARELKTVKDEALPLRVVFISVDPKRDTPVELDRYVHYFDPSFVGLTGSDKDLRRLATLFGAHFEFEKAPDSAVGYTVQHSAALFFVSPQGQLAKTLSPPYAVGAVAEMAKHLSAVGAH